MVSQSIGLLAGRTPVLLDQGWSCERVAAALLLDNDTVHAWHRAYGQGGVEGLKAFGHESSSSHLTHEQEIALSNWIYAHCQRNTRKIGAWLKRTYAVSYSPSGLIALLDRLGFDYRKPEAMPRGRNNDFEHACDLDRQRVGDRVRHDPVVP
jgi:transposase